MRDCLLHVSLHELEAHAGTTQLPRKVAQVSPDKRKREADDDEGEETEEMFINGTYCSHYVLSSGKLTIPNSMWDRASRKFRSEIGKFNRAVGKHNAAASRRCAQEER